MKFVCCACVCDDLYGCVGVGVGVIACVWVGVV